MSHKFFFYIIMLVIFQFHNLYSQYRLTFEYDYCIFKNDDKSSFLEFYYSFYQSEFKFIKTDNGYQADGYIDLRIFPKDLSESVIAQSYKVPLVVADTAGYNRNSKLIGQINFVLQKGEYKVYIKATDYNDTTKSFTILDSVIVENSYLNTTALSSIQLASKIEESNDKSNIFYKYFLEVTPNPSRIFGKNIPHVYYYIELYNLTGKYIADNYNVMKTITDLNNHEIKTDKTSYKLDNNDSKVEHGFFNVSDMSTGKYNFYVSLFDGDGKKLAENKNTFWVYNEIDTSISSEQNLDNMYLLSEYKDYTESQIQEEVDKIKYIITDRYREEIERTNDIEGKRKLLYQFWKKLDPNSVTQVNEFKVSYFERIKYTNKSFKSAFTDGWRTDRGRVYCVYGKPDDVQRFPFEANKKAYEIWKYDAVEGGVEFVFIDLSSDGENYVLVHSTAIRELRDDNWEKRLEIK